LAGNSVLRSTATHCEAAPTSHQPHPGCEVQSTQLPAWEAQYPGQPPRLCANDAAGHALSADPEAPRFSHRPVVAQKPHPGWAVHASQPEKLAHGSPTIARIGKVS
jgi:hypothetical protein